MKHNITSGDQYGMLLSYKIAQIHEIEQSIPEGIIDIWCDDVYNKAVDSYNLYIAGKKDYYELTEEEIEESYKQASMQYIQEILHGMVDKDLLNVSVGEDGDILYSLTEKGQNYKDQIED